MEYLSGILIAIFGLLIIMVLRLITTFFHEMGHALPALLYSEGDVEVYVGSYGDISKSLHLVFGRLKMFLKINIFEWQIGLCRSKKAQERWQQALVTLGGPIASLVISIPVIYLMTKLNTESLAFFGCVVFVAAAVLDLVANLLPSASPLEMHDGGVAFSDGYALLILFQESRMPEEYFELKDLFIAEKYQEVVDRSDEVIDKNPKDKYPYQYMLAALTELGQYDKVLQVYAFQKQHFEFDDDDFFLIGKAYKQTDQPVEAMKFFEKFYFKNYTNPELINEMSELELTFGNPEKAIDRLRPVVKNQPKFYKSFITLARAYMSLEEFTLATEAIQAAETFNQDDPLLYYYKGRAYEKNGQNMIAIQALEKAKELGCQMPGLDFVLENLR